MKHKSLNKTDKYDEYYIDKVRLVSALLLCLKVGDILALVFLLSLFLNIFLVHDDNSFRQSINLQSFVVIIIVLTSLLVNVFCEVFLS